MGKIYLTLIINNLLPFPCYLVGKMIKNNLGFIIIILSIFFISTISFPAVEPHIHFSADDISNPSPNLIPMTRGNQNELIFFYEDKTEDVWVWENKIDNWTSTEGYDIKNITTEQNGNFLWVNMTMHDFVYDDEDIYYKIKVADAEAMLYRGDGSINYQDDTTEFSVWYTSNSISVKIILNKLSFDILNIYAIAYTDTSDDFYGDYTIQDELSGESEELELLLEDPKQDVVISYTQSHLIHSEPEIDILTIKLEDFEAILTVTITFRGNIESSQGFSYVVTLGNARFEFNAGKGTIKYTGKAVQEADFEKKSNSISVDFIKDNLVFDSEHLHIKTNHEATELKKYFDEHFLELPGYIHHAGEKIGVMVNMFQNEEVSILIQGDLNLSNTVELRHYIDKMGNNNNIVEAAELDNFISYLNDKFSTEDFFEFSPYIDSIPGNAELNFSYENATGNINDWKPVKQSIIGRYQFSLLSLNEHNVSFRFLAYPVHFEDELDFALEISYYNIEFKLSPEFKYWELVQNSSQPEVFKTYITETNETITISELDYYIFRNRVDWPEFGFLVRYNQTLADLDAKKSKPEDDSGGFISSFELYLFIAGVFIILTYNGYNKMYKEK